MGLLESLMTATIVDDLMDTRSDKNRKCNRPGLVNIGAGLLGGMAGRGRLSTVIAGMFLFLLVRVVYLDDWLSQIPIAAFVNVMIMVSIGTFSWRSYYSGPN